MADLEAAIESHKKTEEEVQARIRELEKTQVKLIELEEERKKLIEQARAQQVKASQPLPAPQSSTPINWVLGGTTIFSLALCVILMLRMMYRQKPADELWGQNDEPTTVTLGEHHSHPAGIISPAPATVIGTEPHEAHSFIPALPDWDSASPALDSQGLQALAVEKGAQNRDSTIELAEIMLSFGRINSAAEALTNFIEKNPKEAFAPWLKLLEVYRANGQRTEFDKIALKLNKTFNVWTVNWGNFNDALTPAHALETMTHIIEHVQTLWGTRECQAYLQHLLRDTRDETRRGFPLAAIDDILSLNDILEYYLGPYTGPTDIFNNDVLDTAPLTEIEGNKLGSNAPNDGSQMGRDGQEEPQP